MRLSMSAGRTAIGTMTVLACTGLACSSRTLPGTKPAEQKDVFTLTADWAAFKQGPTTAVDILFMVDNSASMAPIQQQLAAGFEAFGRVLDALPGGTPDLHLGIVSSDMGAGDGTIVGCVGSGNDGALQDMPRGACTNTTLRDGAHFIAVRTDPATGQRIANFDASTITEVFTCIANLGDTGCGFEQPFASVLRALGADGSAQPLENEGFLRPDAFLAVVMVGNEDDCSARSGAVSKLFDTEQRLLATEMGPVGSFRCNEFGHLCRRGDGELQAPSRREAASYESCESNEDGLLTSVADFVRSLRALKGDPAKVFVAAVSGPSSPYSVRLEDPSLPDEGGWPVIDHSCSDQGTNPPIYADPAVRIQQATSSFGRYGTFQSICGNGTQIPLEQIAQRMTRPMGHPCVAVPPAGAAACQVIDRWIKADGTKAAAILETCDAAGGLAPCWRLVEDPSACGANRRLQVERDGTEVPPGLMTAIDCSGEAL